MMSREFGMASAVSVIGRYYQHFKASVGVTTRFIPRDRSLCAYAILQDGPLIVADLTRDPRFSDNPFVTGAPNLRFYSGVPLRTRSGHRLGAVCLMDTKPRILSAAEQGGLLKAAEAVTQRLHDQEAACQILALRRAIASEMPKGDRTRISLLGQQLCRALSQQSYRTAAA